MGQDACFLEAFVRAYQARHDCDLETAALRVFSNAEGAYGSNVNLLVETVLLNRPGQPYLGIGEGAQGPTPAAIANAVADALDIDIREVPMTPEKLFRLAGR